MNTVGRSSRSSAAGCSDKRNSAMFSFQSPRPRGKIVKRSPTSGDRETAAAQRAFARAASLPPELGPVTEPQNTGADVPQYWTRNEIRSVSIFSLLPADAQAAVQRAVEGPSSTRGSWTEADGHRCLHSGQILAPRGFVDQHSGWAMIAVDKTGFAWQMKVRSASCRPFLASTSNSGPVDTCQGPDSTSAGIHSPPHSLQRCLDLFPASTWCCAVCLGARVYPRRKVTFLGSTGHGSGSL